MEIHSSCSFSFLLYFLDSTSTIFLKTSFGGATESPPTFVVWTMVSLSTRATPRTVFVVSQVLEAGGRYFEKLCE